MLSSETARMDALHRTGVLDTPADPLFDHLTQLGAKYLKMPTCLISLVDAQRQWFKSRVGIDVQSTPRDVAFCDHAIQGNSVMIVPDATKDPRFAHNPLVVDGIKIRFYAGAPIVFDGHNVGTFCVIDYRPNTQFTVREAKLLEQLAGMAAQLLNKQAPSTDELLL